MSTDKPTPYDISTYPKPPKPKKANPYDLSMIRSISWPLYAI